MDDCVEHGQEIDVDGVPCYEACPIATSDGVSLPGLLFLPDIFGWRSGRTRKIFDSLAAEVGLRVLLPNVFHDDGSDHSIPLTGCSAVWYIARRIMSYDWCYQRETKAVQAAVPWPSILYPIFWTSTTYVDSLLREKFIPYLTTKSNTKNVAVLGFCWGGWIALHAAKLPEVGCAVAMHPSMNMETFHGGKAAALYQAIRCPVMCLAAGEDPDEVKPSGALEAALQESAVVGHHVEEFPDMDHGWVPRGDAQEPKVQKGVADALDKARDFLRQHFEPSKPERAQFQQPS